MKQDPVSDLFAKVAPPRPLSPAQREGIARRLDAALTQAERRRRPWPWVVAALLGVGSLAFAAARWTATATATAPATAPATAAAAAPAPAPAPATATATATATAPATATAAATPAPALAAEARLLRTALRQLRRDGDPTAALTTLKTYARRHPRGALAQEAHATRLEALLVLGREDDARALLVRLGCEAPEELSVKTARAALGRCAP